MTALLTASPLKPADSIPEALVVRRVASSDGWSEFTTARGNPGFAVDPRWMRVFSTAFQHRPYFLEARQGQQLVGILPLAFVKSRLFGRFLVSLPYLNTGGVLADSDEAAARLIDEAIALANELDVKHLELRHERAVEHSGLNSTLTSKVHLRLPLPATSDELWAGFRSKLRSQIKKPLANTDLTAHWGRDELLSEFYDVFCENMRDLGTPPFSRRLFASILAEFPAEAELCVLRHRQKPVSVALLIHGPGVTQVPSASTIRSANRLAANMVLYWRLLERSIERGQNAFDFGRSTVGAGTYDFKKQWGAEDCPAVWQYQVRHGEARDVRPDNPKYAAMIRIWQKLPIAVTRWIGPSIVRGIP